MSNKVKNMRSWLLMLFAAISLGVSAQTITVKGNVKDTTGELIIGASVVEKGNTTNGTITDLDGNYSIKVPSKATLTISYIGMKTQDIAVKGQSQINVTLSDDTQAWCANCAPALEVMISITWRQSAFRPLLSVSTA